MIATRYGPRLPPGIESCLYVGNKRMVPSVSNPMVRQCEASCKQLGGKDPYSHFGVQVRSR